MPEASGTTACPRSCPPPTTRACARRSPTTSPTLFAKTEGIVPAPESCHAVRAAIDKALECKATGEEKTIVFCLSGHGLIDLYGYEQYIEGTLPSSSIDE